MNHDQRIAIAENVSRKILERYKDDVLCIAIYGSTAKGTDMADSDIDMLVVSKTRSSWGAYHLKGVMLWLAFKSIEQFNSEFYNVGDTWPYEVGQMMYAKILYQHGNFIGDMKERIAKLDASLFLKPAEQHLNESEEIMVKLVHASQSRDVAAVRYWVPLFLEHTNLLIALLNRSWFTYNAFMNIINVGEFKEVPKGYADWARMMLSINDSNTMGDLARDIWEGCRRLAEKHGIKPKHYQNETDIEL